MLCKLCDLFTRAVEGDLCENCRYLYTGSEEKENPKELKSTWNDNESVVL
jgi:hypothetical protein